MGRPLKPQIGKIYGKLTVICRAENTPDAHPQYLCRCSCGNVKKVKGTNLPRTKSCGCWNRKGKNSPSYKHGKTRTKVWLTWINMLKRCQSDDEPDFHIYKGRGIRVCSRWHDFNNFYADMGDPPSKQHSIDRIDTNGNYTPDNCRWATVFEQANNTRKNVRINFRGKNKTVSQWAQCLGLNKDVLYGRIRRRKTTVGIITEEDCRND